MDKDDERAELVNRAVDSLDFPDSDPQATGVPPTAPPGSPRAPRPKRSLFVNVVVFVLTLLGGVILGGDGRRRTAATEPQQFVSRRRAVHSRR